MVKVEVDSSHFAGYTSATSHPTLQGTHVPPLIPLCMVHMWDTCATSHPTLQGTHVPPLIPLCRVHMCDLLSHSAGYTRATSHPTLQGTHVLPLIPLYMGHMCHLSCHSAGYTCATSHPTLQGTHVPPLIPLCREHMCHPSSHSAGGTSDVPFFNPNTVASKFHINCVLCKVGITTKLSSVICYKQDFIRSLQLMTCSDVWRIFLWLLIHVRRLNFITFP